MSGDGKGYTEVNFEINNQIRDWAKERGLDTADPFKQALKLIEEVGELAEGLVKGNKKQIIDSIGDVYVVLTIFSLQLGYDIEYCIEQAYKEIANRKGEMVNGVFVKDEDLLRQSN